MNSRSQRVLLRKEFPMLLTMLFGGLGAILAFIGTHVQSVPWLEYREVKSGDPSKRLFEIVSINHPMKQVEILFTTKPDEARVRLDAALNPTSGTYFTLPPDAVKKGEGYCYVSLPPLPSGQPLSIEIKANTELSKSLDVALSFRDVDKVVGNAANAIVLRKQSPVTFLARHYLSIMIWLAVFLVLGILLYAALILGWLSGRQRNSGRDSPLLTPRETPKQDRKTDP